MTRIVSFRYSGRLSITCHMGDKTKVNISFASIPLAAEWADRARGQGIHEILPSDEEIAANAIRQQTDAMIRAAGSGFRRH